MNSINYVSNPVDNQGYVHWSAVENSTWSELIKQHHEIMQSRACTEFVSGLNILNYSDHHIPQIPDVNERLSHYSGWEVAPVAALIQPKEFFTLLAHKKFPAATFIRSPQALDYLQEPDIFHEIYGHTPLLTNQKYADFMQRFGELALIIAAKDRSRLFRLFWFTIEFGLLNTDAGLRAYGGGILSSTGEMLSCFTDRVKTQTFDALNVLRTSYRIDIMQPVYFVIDSFDDLFKILDQDIQSLLQESKELGDFSPRYRPKLALKSSTSKTLAEKNEENHHSKRGH